MSKGQKSGRCLWVTVFHEAAVIKSWQGQKNLLIPRAARVLSYVPCGPLHRVAHHTAPPCPRVNNLAGNRDQDRSLNASYPHPKVTNLSSLLQYSVGRQRPTLIQSRERHYSIFITTLWCRCCCCYFKKRWDTDRFNTLAWQLSPSLQSARMLRMESCPNHFHELHIFGQGH